MEQVALAGQVLVPVPELALVLGKEHRRLPALSLEAAASSDANHCACARSQGSGACWPISRVLSDLAIRMIIPLDVMSPSRSSSQPAASWSRRTVSRRLFDLAPTGVYRAINVTADAVGSYPTFSPLPLHCWGGGLFSVALSVTTRVAPRHYLAVCPRSPDFPRWSCSCCLHANAIIRPACT